MAPRSESHAPHDGDGSRVIKTVRFRRGRATKACEVCHARKVRCDMTENFPCTNCRAFSLVCVPREGKGKGRKADANHTHSEIAAKIETQPSAAAAVAVQQQQQQQQQQQTQPPQQQAPSQSPQIPPQIQPQIQQQQAAHPPPQPAEPKPWDVNGSFVYKPEGLSPAVCASESCYQWNDQLRMRNATRFLDSWRGGTNSTGDQPEDQFIVGLLKHGSEKAESHSCDADIISLRAQGSLLLPSPEMSDHLVDVYFQYVHPYVPVVNRREFMAEYRQDRDKPSLMLRQSMFCVASRFSDHPDLLDKEGTTRQTALAMYRRAKALFDLRFDSNVETWVASAVILSLAVENPLFMEHNGYYWVRVAAAQAQGVGMHRKLRHEETSPEQRSRWRLIWWTLYKRDIATAMAYGRPVVINLEDCDVEMISANDFVDGEGTIVPGSDIEINVNYFIHSVRLHEILALIMRIQFTVGAERLRRLHLLPDVTQCDRALAEWVSQLPESLSYSIKDQQRHHYVRALLYLEYYTVVCLSHRPQVSHLFKVNGWQNFPTWSVAFQAAHMICKILENFGQHHQLRKLPGFAVYSCFTALLMMSFQRRVSRDSDEMVMAAVNQGLDSFREICKIMAQTHATGSWIVQLAQDLQKERAFHQRASSRAKAHQQNHHYQNGKQSTGLNGLTLATGEPNLPNSSSVSPLDEQPQPLFSKPVPPIGCGGAAGADANTGTGTGTGLPTTPAAGATATGATPTGNGSLTPSLKIENLDSSFNSGSINTPGTTPMPNSSGHTADPHQHDLFEPVNPMINDNTVSVNDLFPQDSGFIDFPTELGINHGSGDEGPPETLNIADFYDFLNNGVKPT